jgi:hypothetical protein
MANKPRQTAGKYLRTTITVPAELKARMDAVWEPINWSQVASEAFARKLDELAAGPGCSGSLDMMAARLRSARHSSIDASYEAGWQHGRDWAMRQADLDHLVRFERMYRHMTDEDWLRLAVPKAGRTPTDELLRRLYPQLYEDPYQRQGFWSGVGIRELTGVDELAFVRGFCEAVLDAWLKVKDQVGPIGWWCPTGAAEKKKRKN